MRMIMSMYSLFWDQNCVYKQPQICHIYIYMYVCISIGKYVGVFIYMYLYTLIDTYII